MRVGAGGGEGIYAQSSILGATFHFTQRIWQPRLGNVNPTIPLSCEMISRKKPKPARLWLHRCPPTARFTRASLVRAPE